MRYLVKRIPSTSLVQYDGSRYYCEIAGGTSERATVDGTELLAGSKYLDVQTGTWYVYDELTNAWAVSAEGGSADPAVVEAAVEAWLDSHPEATTTVQDGSISYAKLDTNLKGKADAVTQLSDEIDEAVAELQPIAEITGSETKSVASNAILSAFQSIGDSKIASGNIIKITDAIAIKSTVSGMASGENVISCGINVFDEVFESGYYDQTTGEPKPASRIRSKNPIPVFPGATFNVIFVQTVSVSILGYDASGVYKGVLYDRGGGGSFTVPSGVYQLKLYFGTAYGTTYNNNFCLSFNNTNLLNEYVASLGRKISDFNEIMLFNGANIVYGSLGSTLQVYYYANKTGSSANIQMMPKLTLLSYNIRCLRGGESGAGYDALTPEQISTTLANFKRLFQKIKPDIFVVCEDRTYFDTGAFDTTGGTRSVYTELWEHYFPYRYNQSTGANEPHIYSKYPFAESLKIPVEYGQSATSNRQPPAVKINVDGFDIWIVGLHPVADASAYEADRVPYFDAVVDFAEDKDYVIACGDFNTDTSTPENELIVFTNAGMELGNMGYFGKFATYRFGTAVYLDNIVTKGMTLNNFTVGDETYSDHFPISGELNVRL